MRNFNLFGEPLPANLGEPGRNEHAPSAENDKKIRMLLVAKWTLDQIAAEIGLSVPTIRKHYFASGRVNLKRARELAVAEVRGRTLLQLDKAAEAGNVSAMKELRKIAEREALAELPAAMAKGQPKAQQDGKKDALKKAAKKPKGGWADRGLPGLH